MTNDLIFDLQEVSCAHQGALVLGPLSLQIRAGSRVAILGANGSGKTTLLRLLDALHYPHSGVASAFGQRIDEANFADDEVNFAFRRRVGLVFQNPDVQLFNPTVFDELAFGPLQLGWPRERILTAVEESLARLRITHLRQRAPHRLSGGEKKRVALASVLIMEPEVLLLDEPTAALDPESQGEILRFLAEGQGSGRTIVTTTHDLHLVEGIAEHVIVLGAGKLVAQGTPAEILGNEALLRATHLIHSHWHRHADGEVHEHDHLHAHSHAHVASSITLATPYRPLQRSRP
jgi:cobalt/nickel transport system ATP-binding protein